MVEISVIVPIYNCDGSIERCIKSIIDQTFQDFELILVDDGSTDESGELCDNFQRIDKRIKVLHTSNKGVSSARNTGIVNSKGRYIMFCDGDDYVEKNWCEVLLEAIKNNPKALVSSNYKSVSDTVRIQYEGDDMGFETDYYHLFKYGISPFVWNKIFDNYILKQYNILFDEKLEHGEDVVFTLEYLKHCQKCIFIKSILYSYVYNSESAARKYTYDSLYHVLNAFYWRVPFIDECYLEEYCDIYLYDCYYRLEMVFDKRNKMSFLRKMHFNNKMLNSEQFIFCINHASGKNEGLILLKILKMHNYYLLWVFQKAVWLKNCITKKRIY